MRRLSLPVIAIFISLLALPALAQETIVHVPVGNWIDQVQPYIIDVLSAVAVAIIGFVVSRLPPAIKVFVNKAMIDQVEQLLFQAVSYGINAVAGAQKGKTLDVDTGNAVVAQAAQYAIDHGPEKLIAWMGGPDAIVQKIIARLDLEAEAHAADGAAPLAAPTPTPAPAPLAQG